MPGTPDLRASDAEREQVVAALREHAGEGRLTIEELDERCSAALAARTRGDLAALMRDLPPIAAPPAPPAPPAEPPHDARGIGVRPFTYEWHPHVTPEVAMDEALRHIAPALHRYGYELTEKSPARLGFTYMHRPLWTWVLAVLAFPVGLLALLYTERERVVLDFDRMPAGITRLVATGRAPRRVRRAFAELVVA